MSFRPTAAALAGVAGTVAMTAAMRRLNRQLPASARYPLPPRELVEAGGQDLPEPLAEEVTLLGHAGYGAATGAIMPLLIPRTSVLNGALYGGLVWMLSYLGWIPASGLLKNAACHPPSRNLAMIAVHLVWGGVTALAYKELTSAQEEIFAGHDAPDADQEF
ncbi:MAG: hypothetical protein ACXIVO_08775 [Glycocaulis sp.]